MVWDGDDYYALTSGHAGGSAYDPKALAEADRRHRPVGFHAVRTVAAAVVLDPVIPAGAVKVTAAEMQAAMPCCYPAGKRHKCGTHRA